jgi:hypothetical protein
VGETGIKLIGAYFAASGLVSAISLAATLVVPSIEGFPSARQIAAANALSVVGVLVVAAICLLRAEALAAKIFDDDEIELSGLSRADLFLVGLLLLGISIALEGVPGLLQFAGKALWYAEASRQSMFMPAMERSWEPLVNSVLALVIGGAVTAGARRLAAALDMDSTSSPHGHEPAR